MNIKAIMWSLYLISGNNQNRFLALVFAPLFLVSLGMVSHDAFAMGDAPSTCTNRYDGTITSFVINAGTQTFDVMANPGVTLKMNMPDSNYTVSFVIHTNNASSLDNSDPGTTWYDDNAFAFQDGHCVPSRTDATIGPDQDISIDKTFSRPATYSPTREQFQTVTFHTTVNGVSYNVIWAGSPTAPQNLVANASDSQVSLSWSRPANNGGSAITGYAVYRGTTANGEGTTAISTIDKSTLSYTDTGLTNNQTYFYIVRAVNAMGESSPSNEASATPEPTTLSSATTSQLQVNSQDSYGNPLSGFYAKLYAQNGTQIDAGHTPYNFTLDNGQAYTVHVGNSATYKFNHWLDTGSTNASRTISITSDESITAVYATIPTHPSNLTATAVSPSEIDLSWSAPSSDGGSPITGYRIQISTEDSPWTTLVKNTGNTSTTYSDTGLSPDTTYHYRVFALNAVDSSYRSNIASATTPDNDSDHNSDNDADKTNVGP